MNDAVPYLFFFSYSRADWKNDVYLGRFFQDLERRVAIAKGLGDAKVGFRDEEGAKLGDDWKSQISAAVQKSNVLVCIYTPNFFSKERTDQFCGKEFMAFLKRSPTLRYERIVDQGRHAYQVRDARNILPVLWLSESELEFNKLPPCAVRTIQYTLNFANVPSNLNDQYKKKGMSLIATRRTGTYREILSHLARRIVEMGADPPPPVMPPPDVAALRNAFDDPPEIEADGEAAAPRPADVVVVPAPETHLGPKEIIAFEIRIAADDASHWMPYADEPSLRGLVEEVAQSRRLVCSYRKVELGDANWLENLLSALRDATERCARPILFIDPTCLSNKERRTALVSLLRQKWRGGIIIPVPDEASGALVEETRGEFNMSPDEREWIIFRVGRGGAAEFRTAVVSVADEILARIVEHGDVQRKAPANAGPITRPRIANTLDAWRSEP